MGCEHAVQGAFSEPKGLKSFPFHYMTSEEFYARYQVLEALSMGAVRSYRAREESGREVLLHFLAEPPQPGTPLVGVLEQTEPLRAPLLQRLQVDSLTVLVSESVPEFESLESLLATAEPPRSAAAEEPGEYTRLFGAEPVTPPPAGAPSPPSVEDGRRTSGAEEEISAFGSMPTEPMTPPDRPTEPGTSGPSPEVLGEFTQLFGAKPAAGLTKGPVTEAFAPPTSRKPSEVPPPPPPPRQPAPASPPPASAGEPGEFTRLFGADDGPALSPKPPPRTAVPPPKPSPPVPSPVRKDTDEAYRARLRNDPIAPGPAASPPASAPAPAPTGTPGEYTRMMSSGPAPAPPVPTSPSPKSVEPAAKADRPKSRRDLVVLIAVLAVVFVLAAVLIGLAISGSAPPVPEPVASPEALPG